MLKRILGDLEGSNSEVRYMDELKKIITSLILRTDYKSSHTLPHIAHRKILLKFKSILKNLGFTVQQEKRQIYHKNKGKIIYGCLDLFAKDKNKSIALEYDAGSYWRIGSIRKLRDVDSDFIVLIIGSGSIHNQYHLNQHKRLLMLTAKKGFVASLRWKEIDSIQNLLRFYRLNSPSFEPPRNSSFKQLKPGA